MIEDNDIDQDVKNGVVLAINVYDNGAVVDYEDWDYLGVIGMLQEHINVLQYQYNIDSTFGKYMETDNG